MKTRYCCDACYDTAEYYIFSVAVLLLGAFENKLLLFVLLWLFFLLLGSHVSFGHIIIVQ